MKFGRKDYDGGKSIPQGEPAFLLRGQDEFAEATVRFYANLIESHGGDAALVASARKQADAIKAWETKKSPDLAKS